MSFAIICSRSVRVSESRNSIALTIDLFANSSIFIPPTVTHSDSFLSLAPWHSGHFTVDIHCSSSARDQSLVVSLYLRSILLQMPSNAVIYEPVPYSFLRVSFSFSPFVPYIIASTPSAGISLNGVSRVKPYLFAMPSMYICAIVPPSALFQPLAFIAPCLSERFLSGTIRLGSGFMKTLSPEQVGQAPNGLLNENIRGSSSSMLTPCSGQA